MQGKDECDRKSVAVFDVWEVAAGGTVTLRVFIAP